MTDSTSQYRIVDDPIVDRRPGWVVRPLWPLFAAALTGTVPAMLWFAYNSHAMGSATRRRELVLAAIGILGAVVASATLLVFREQIPAAAFPYSVIGLVTWKLLLSYAIYVDQARSIEIFQYYGGRLRNGFIPFVVVGTAIRAVGSAVYLEAPFLGILIFDRLFRPL